MHIAPLDGLAVPALVNTIVRAFEGYFVAIPNDPLYWEERFHCAGVDLSRSYGVFDGDTLTAFIIQAFRTVEAEPTAYNSGTGVLPAYRGRRLIDTLYAHAIPHLKQQGVTRCALEVIDRNAVALRVYERIGFRIVHGWKCFRGTLHAPLQKPEAVLVEGDMHNTDLGSDALYSWDHHRTGMRLSRGGQQLYLLDGDVAKGHVVWSAATGRIARIAVADENDMAQWQRLLAALHAIRADVLLVNVHPERTVLLEALRAAGLQNPLDQFEMHLALV